MAVPAMFLPIFVYWIPIFSLILGIWNSDAMLIVAGAAAYAVQAILLVPVSRICRIHWHKALCFPLAAVPVIACFTRALYHRLVSGAVVWRGRSVSVCRSES